MEHIMRFINLLFVVVLLSACSTTANIDYDKKINFNQFKSFRIQEKPIRISSDTRVNSSFMQQRVAEEINTSLLKKGFVKSDKGSDLEIKYFLDLKKEFERYDSGVSVGFGSFSRRSSIGLGLNFPFDEGRSVDNLMLTIDVFSAQSNKLIWRGSATEFLESRATPETYTTLVRALVTEIINEFPPK